MCLSGVEELLEEYRVITKDLGTVEIAVARLDTLRCCDENDDGDDGDDELGLVRKVLSSRAERR